MSRVQTNNLVPLSQTDLANAATTGLISPNSRVLGNASLIPQTNTSGVIVNSSGNPINSITSGVGSAGGFIPAASNSIGNALSGGKSVAVKPINVHVTAPNTATGIAVGKAVADAAANKNATIPITSSSLYGAEAPAVQISDELGELDPNSVEYTLANYGYIPISKVVTSVPIDGENQNQSMVDVVRYIKTVNSKGQYVYVEPDIAAEVEVDPKDLTLVQSKVSSQIPYMVRTTTQECLKGEEICNMLMDCGDDGMCTMSLNEENGAIEEENFITTETYSQRAGLFNGDPIAYPIVKLSEIKADPLGTSRRINAATRRLRQAAQTQCKNNLLRLKSSLEGVNKAFNNYYNAQMKLDANLNKSIGYLEDLEDKYHMLNNKILAASNAVSPVPSGCETCPLVNRQVSGVPATLHNQIAIANNNEKHRLVSLNLKKRNELYHRLNGICLEVGNMTRDLEQDAKNLNEYAAILNNEEKYVNLTLL